MALPVPEAGLVISYAYLWNREFEAGQQEGRKDRPSVIVMAVERRDGREVLVTVVPITHSPPKDGNTAIEVPQSVKRHLGLDADQSWIMVNEGNRFIWPGYDVRKVQNRADHAYGMLPPKLFSKVAAAFRSFGLSGKARLVARD